VGLTIAVAELAKDVGDFEARTSVWLVLTMDMDPRDRLEEG
jgi:hypothetical protein